ncbi:hypothetical protein ACIQMJ_12250 [Actinosynnema sp. NPDC091369]
MLLAGVGVGSSGVTGALVTRPQPLWQCTSAARPEAAAHAGGRAILGAREVLMELLVHGTMPRAEIAKRLRLSRNDVQALPLAEHRFGAGVDSMVLITVGAVGGGPVDQGRRRRRDLSGAVPRLRRRCRPCR